MFSSYYNNWSSSNLNMIATPRTILSSGIYNPYQVPAPVHDLLCADIKEDKIRLLKATKLLTVQHL